MNTRGAEPFRGGGVGPPRRDAMDKAKDEDLPHRDQAGIEAEAEKNRQAEDSIPPHGTDPLHEGP
jgi:hypothetical protein